MKSVGHGIERSLFMAEWEGLNPDDVKVTMNNDFIDVRLPTKRLLHWFSPTKWGISWIRCYTT